MGAIFTYGFDLAKNNFAKANCELFTLSDYSTLIDEALHLNYIDKQSLESLDEWRRAPQIWNK
jgi:orotate phosphoribosyltransferase